MKRFLIKLFRLKYLEDVIYKAMQKQQDEDDRKYNKILINVRDLYEDKLILLAQEKDAKIRMLESEIRTWEDRERAIEKREYKAAMQISINHEIASTIVKETSEIVSNAGRLQGAYDKAEIQHEKIKELK